MRLARQIIDNGADHCRGRDKRLGLIDHKRPYL